MICVDSSVWIDYFNAKDTGSVQILDALIGREPLIVGEWIYTEVLQGFRSDKDFRTAKRLLDLCEFKSMSGIELAFQSASNYRLLRKRGVTVRKTIDVWIGTYCIEGKYPLLHSDRDFDPMEKYLGLQVVKTH